MKTKLTIALLLSSLSLAMLLAAESRPQTVSQSAESKASQTSPPQFDLEKYQFGLLYRGEKWTPEKTAETEKLQAGHMAHINRMAETGKLIAAGPMGDNGNLRGIFLFRGVSLDEARLLAADDPTIKAGRLKMDLYTWWGPKGIGAKYNERVQANAGKFTMTMHHLVLLWKGENHANDSAAIQTAHLWNIRKMMDAGKMPLAGPFENGGDLRGIFVFATGSADEAKAWADADPAVKAGRLKTEIHPWYVAKEVMP